MTTANTANTYNIATAAMLVEFNASVWTARKLDKTATDEVVISKHARASDAARVNKHLMAGRNELEQIQKVVGAARTYVYEHTMPWSNSGQRLLPAVQFMGFDKRLREFEQEFGLQVSAFLNVYPTLVTAQALALGQMFNRDDFPTADKLRNKFDFSFTYLPVPTQGDFRVDVGNEGQQYLVEKLEKIAEERVQAAHRELWGRLKEHLDRMIDRLAVDSVDGTEKPRRFHDTLVSGGLELCELLKALNILQDPQLEQARVSLSNTLSGVHAEDLRHDLAHRADIQKKAQEIRNRFAF